MQQISMARKLSSSNLELTEQRDSLLTSVCSDEDSDDSGDDTDYGSALDGSADKRTGNQRAQLIWTHCKKRVYKMSYEEIFVMNATFAELVLSMDVPFREEFLEKRSVPYPLIQKYKGLDNNTLSGLLIAWGYFLERKRKDVRLTGVLKQIAQIAELDMERTVQTRVRKHLVAEFMARPVSAAEEESGLLGRFFCWKARPPPRRIPLDMLTM